MVVVCLFLKLQFAFKMCRFCIKAGVHGLEERRESVVGRKKHEDMCSIPFIHFSFEHYFIIDIMAVMYI
jgi:hypothetical protein